MNKIFGINKIINKYKKISCGAFHVCCIDIKNNIYTFGDNSDGQCGISKEIKKISCPKLLEVNENIQSIDCGAYHTIIKTSNMNSKILFIWIK